MYLKSNFIIRNCFLFVQFFLFSASLLHAMDMTRFSELLIYHSRERPDVVNDEVHVQLNYLSLILVKACSHIEKNSSKDRAARWLWEAIEFIGSLNQGTQHPLHIVYEKLVEYISHRQDLDKAFFLPFNEYLKKVNTFYIKLLRDSVHHIKVESFLQNVNIIYEALHSTTLTQYLFHIFLRSSSTQLTALAKNIASLELTQEQLKHWRIDVVQQQIIEGLATHIITEHLPKGSLWPLISDDQKTLDLIYRLRWALSQLEGTMALYHKGGSKAVPAQQLPVTIDAVRKVLASKLLRPLMLLPQGRQQRLYQQVLRVVYSLDSTQLLDAPESLALSQLPELQQLLAQYLQEHYHVNDVISMSLASFAHLPKPELTTIIQELTEVQDRAVDEAPKEESKQEEEPVSQNTSPEAQGSEPVQQPDIPAQSPPSDSETLLEDTGDKKEEKTKKRKRKKKKGSKPLDKMTPIKEEDLEPPEREREPSDSGADQSATGDSPAENTPEMAASDASQPLPEPATVASIPEDFSSLITLFENTEPEYVEPERLQIAENREKPKKWQQKGKGKGKRRDNGGKQIKTQPTMKDAVAPSSVITVSFEEFQASRKRLKEDCDQIMHTYDECLVSLDVDECTGETLLKATEGLLQRYERYQALTSTYDQDFFRMQPRMSGKVTSQDRMDHYLYLLDTMQYEQKQVSENAYYIAQNWLLRMSRSGQYQHLEKALQLFMMAIELAIDYRKGVEKHGKAKKLKGKEDIAAPGKYLAHFYWGMADLIKREEPVLIEDQGQTYKTHTQIDFLMQVIRKHGQRLLKLDKQIFSASGLEKKIPDPENLNVAKYARFNMMFWAADRDDLTVLLSFLPLYIKYLNQELLYLRDASCKKSAQLMVMLPCSNLQSVVELVNKHLTSNIIESDLPVTYWAKELIKAYDSLYCVEEYLTHAIDQMKNNLKLYNTHLQTSRSQLKKKADQVAAQLIKEEQQMQIKAQQREEEQKKRLSQKLVETKIAEDKTQQDTTDIEDEAIVKESPQKKVKDWHFQAERARQAGARGNLQSSVKAYEKAISECSSVLLKNLLTIEKGDRQLQLILSRLDRLLSLVAKAHVYQQQYQLSYDLFIAEQPYTHAISADDLFTLIKNFTEEAQKLSPQLGSIIAEQQAAFSALQHSKPDGEVSREDIENNLYFLRRSLSHLNFILEKIGQTFVILKKTIWLRGEWLKALSKKKPHFSKSGRIIIKHNARQWLADIQESFGQYQIMDMNTQLLQEQLDRAERANVPAGYVLYLIDGDGHCLFSALATALNLVRPGNNWKQKDVRRTIQHVLTQLVNHINQNKLEALKQELLLIMDVGSWQALENMQMTGLLLGNVSDDSPLDLHGSVNLIALFILQEPISVGVVTPELQTPIVHSFNLWLDQAPNLLVSVIEYGLFPFNSFLAINGDIHTALQSGDNEVIQAMSGSIMAEPPHFLVVGNHYGNTLASHFDLGVQQGLPPSQSYRPPRLTPGQNANSSQPGSVYDRQGGSQPVIHWQIEPGQSYLW